MCNVQKNGNFMVNFVNFTPQSWQSISLKSNTKPQENQATTVSNPASKNKGTYPLMDARNALLPSVSFKANPTSSTFQPIADPSDGFSNKTGLSTPVSFINKTNFKKIGIETETLEETSKEGPRRGKNKKTQKTTVTHDVYRITDTQNGVTIDCTGKVDPATGKLKMTQLKKVTFDYGNGKKFVSNFSGKISNCNDLGEDEIDEFLTAFVKASTGFCANNSNCDGMKTLASENSAGDRRYARISNGKEAKFELKIKDSCEYKDANFGDMRYFSYGDPQQNGNQWEMNWSCYERHSSCHHSKW